MATGAWEECVGLLAEYLHDRTYVAIAYLDAAGVLRECNRAFLQLLELPEKPLGRPLATLLAAGSGLPALPDPGTDLEVRLPFAAVAAAHTLTCRIAHTGHGYLLVGERLMLTASDALARMAALQADAHAATRTLHQQNLALGAEVQQRQATEAALRESQARLLALTENTPDVIFLKDRQGRYCLVNAAACAVVGQPREAILGRDDGAVFPPDVARQAVAHDQAVLAAGAPQTYEETLTLQGDPRTFLVVKGPLVDRQGAPLGLFGIARDITARQRMEAALRASEEQLALAITGSGVGLWDWRVQTGAVTFNARWAEIVGYTLDELAPVSIQTWLALCHPEDMATSTSRLQAHFAGETPAYECEARMRHKAGHWVWVLDRGAVVERAPDGTPLRMTGTHLDITVRKQLEAERLIRSKLESTGLLAAGIAHDFNNLLTVILGNLECLEAGSELERGEVLGEMREAVDQAHALTQQFLAFARGGGGIRQPVEVGALCRAAVSLALRGAAVTATLHLPDAPVVVDGDPKQLGLALRNLLVNAMEAMPSDGQLTLTAENGPDPLRVCITLTDPGMGIPPELLPKVFDPYFSTKQRGDQRGMGLGLTVARAIVEQHRGSLTLASTVGVGTTVQITLPTILPAAAA